LKLIEECVGDNNTQAVLYKVVTADRVVWHREEPLAVEEDTGVIKYDCRVHPGNFQHFSFGGKETNPPPPFNDLLAPLEDIPVLDKEGKEIIGKDGKAKIKMGYGGKAKGIA